jgi:hypothetical protein
MSATEDTACNLNPMPDDSAGAVGAGRRKRVDRTFEAIECVTPAVFFDIERLVVLIAADFAGSHSSPSLRNPPFRCSVAK